MDHKIYTALGLMSGTSLDGVDAAFLETDGHNIIRFGPSLSLPYSKRERSILEAATKAALKWRFNGNPPDNLMAAEHVIHLSHINIVEQLLETFPGWAERLELIGFHGQTVLHIPGKSRKIGQTLQLGAGQILADKFQIPCVYDFRTEDVKAGGQGAPLAPIYHQALINWSQNKIRTIVLNLGGVGNLTYVSDDCFLATDTGPSNGPLDSWMNGHGHKYDENGQISAKGVVRFDLIDKWLAQDFFQRPLPRSADRYDFDVSADLVGLSLEDGAATLAAFAALSVKKTVSALQGKVSKMVICGGGRHNRTIMNMLKSEFPFSVIAAEHMGWDSDMIEAQAFAFLAVRSFENLPISFPETTGVPRSMTGGVIAYPKD